MATFNQWHIEELTLDLDSNTQGAIPVIYGRQGDKDGILCNIELTQQGMPTPPSWFIGKRIYFEARGNGISVRKQADEVVNGVVKVVLPEALFNHIGLVKENFLRVEDATTGATIISGTTSFQVYVRQGNLDPSAAPFYLEEVESVINEIKKWFQSIKGTVDGDTATSLAHDQALLREYMNNFNDSMLNQFRANQIVVSPEAPTYSNMWYQEKGETDIGSSLEPSLYVQNAAVSDDAPLTEHNLWFDIEEEEE